MCNQHSTVYFVPDETHDNINLTVNISHFAQSVKVYLTAINATVDLVHNEIIETCVCQIVTLNIRI